MTYYESRIVKTVWLWPKQDKLMENNRKLRNTYIQSNDLWHNDSEVQKDSISLLRKWGQMGTNTEAWNLCEDFDNPPESNLELSILYSSIDASSQFITSDKLFLSYN